MATIKLYPSSISTVLAWTNANNALTDNSVYATTGGTRNRNHEIIGSGFDLSSIPDGATINSVALEVKYKLSTTASAWTGTLLAIKNGSPDNGTAITTDTEPTVDTVWQNTGTGSYTKETLSQLEVLFRVRRSSNTACTYSVDYLAIEVDYTTPETTTIAVPVSTGSVVAFAPTVTVDVNVSATPMEAVASFQTPTHIILALISLPKLGDVTSEMLVPVVSSTAQVNVPSLLSEVQASAIAPSILTNNILGVPVSTVTAQAFVPELNIRHDILIQIPVSNATANMLTPFRESTSKLMTIDSLLNLTVLGEIVEGSVVNLDKYGVLTIVEIIEGNEFSLSSTGVLTVNTFIEEGI